MPTGGVNAENLKDYLADPAVIACGGTWMCKPAMIRAGEFDRICELSREATAIVRG
jgi:2-dehydro-3-deoxyphosphogluconate aldolase/(4S)-4-hydroxy-2-oxoglutarate aldolase